MELHLLKFNDTIGIGPVDTISYNLINLSGAASLPFTSTGGVIAIELDETSLGAYMLSIDPAAIIFPLDLISFDVDKNMFKNLKK